MGTDIHHPQPTQLGEWLLVNLGEPEQHGAISDNLLQVVSNELLQLLTFSNRVPKEPQSPLAPPRGAGQGNLREHGRLRPVAPQVAAARCLRAVRSGSTRRSAAQRRHGAARAAAAAPSALAGAALTPSGAPRPAQRRRSTRSLRLLRALLAALGSRESVSHNR